jgi:hypothetical protein
LEQAVNSQLDQIAEGKAELSASTLRL